MIKKIALVTKETFSHMRKTLLKENKNKFYIIGIFEPGEENIFGNNTLGDILALHIKEDEKIFSSVLQPLQIIKFICDKDETKTDDILVIYTDKAIDVIYSIGNWLIDYLGIKFYTKNGIETNDYFQYFPSDSVYEKSDIIINALEEAEKTK